MKTTAPPELRALEKLRGEELEEARSIQSMMMPAESLRAGAVVISLTLQLQPGDSVLFCTDGITDAFDSDGEQFGVGRLQELCDAPRPGSPTELLGRVFAAVKNFSKGREQHDDMATAMFHLCD